jgi:hypothetical protein
MPEESDRTHHESAAATGSSADAPEDLTSAQAAEDNTASDPPLAVPADNDGSEPPTQYFPFKNSVELWTIVGQNQFVNENDYGGIKDAAEKIKLKDYDENRLIALLIANGLSKHKPALFFPYGLVEDSESKWKRFGSRLFNWSLRFVREHWIDFVVPFALLVLLGWMGLRLGDFALKEWERTGMKRQVTITTERGLPAFHKVTEKDVAIVEKTVTPGSFSSVDEIIGKYVISDIPRETVITGNHILTDSAHQFDAGEYYRLHIQIKPENFDSSIKAPAIVTMLLAGKDAKPESSVLIKNVVLIHSAKREKTHTLTLALTENQLQSVKGLINNAEIFVLPKSVAVPASSTTK